LTSAAVKPAEFRLASHEASLAQLSSVMRRTGSRLDPVGFIEAVSLAFQEVHSRNSSQQAELAFRTDPSFRSFETALHLAWDAGSPQAILVLGCGPGFAGKTAEFALSTVAEICQPPASRRIDSLDVSPALLGSLPESLSGRPQSYDLIVSHSLLHFIPDVNQFFQLVRFLLKPSGGLILSHEPNAAFWRNPACMAAIVDLRKRNRRRGTRILLPANWRARLNTLIGRSRPGFWDEVNRVLANRYGFIEPLAENEIRRIIDVHRPEAVPGKFRIGLEGFDMDEVRRTYLPGFRAIWTATCEHLGYTPRRSLSPQWQRKEAELAAEHPWDGSLVTTYWRQEPRL
jgi:SAM-dependent methyltransferase